MYVLIKIVIALLICIHISLTIKWLAISLLFIPYKIIYTVM